MTKTAREFFLSKQGHSYDQRFAQQQGTIRFEVAGAGNWRLRIEKGDLELAESNEPANCTLQFSEPDLLAILNDKSSLITLFLRGRIRLHGDRAIAAGAQNFFREAA